ncbi:MULTISPECIES: hypothetical protein [Streptomyces]|uniref:hypothetical protein n=1 Tax=Streptomyces TaxID=1883 RepID=UPI001E382BC7|nr:MULTISPECIES: hypothetical protein [Streptomyces]UFQ16848.1 hypothetical protein J2N69_18620 [Streptomyces huasconensis]WCL86450.1 hypothetical protein PPN52_18625 [Streptomyces sp. JCM 35825]
MNEYSNREGQTDAAALRKSHAARAESAAARSAALSRFVEQHGSGEHADAKFRAAHAARIAAQAFAVLGEGAPAAAADSRCARNAAASAAQASQAAKLVHGDAEPSSRAFQAALKASQAAATAASAPHLGTNVDLNTEADAAERAAVSAAESAGWVQPGEEVPAVEMGIRSTEVHSMMHF